MCNFCYTDLSGTLDILNAQGVSGSPGAEGWDYHGQTFGVAIADVDGDGLLDLYVNHHTNSPAELIFGFATAAARHSFVVPTLDGVNDQHGAVFFDIDGDGDLDLLESRGGSGGAATADSLRHANEVYENVGGSLLVDDQAARLGLDHAGARGRVMVPINLDGRGVGMFVAAEHRDDGLFPSMMMRQTDDGTFRKVSMLKVDLDGYTDAIGAHFGADDCIDVVLLSRNDLRVNLDVANGTRAADRLYLDLDGEAAKEFTIADFDGDLRNDIVVALRQGPSKILTVDPEAGGIVELGKLPGSCGGLYSINAGDLDNDGDVDLVGLGHLDEFGATELSFFSNEGGGGFTRSTLDTGSVGKPVSVNVGDFNGDGTLDLLVSDGRGGKPGAWQEAVGGYTLLKGEPTGNHWLSVELAGTSNETSGLGARVYVETADGARQMREQDGGVKGFTQDPQWLHFGLGETEGSVDLTVIWADGKEQVIAGVEADQHVTFEEATVTLYVHEFARKTKIVVQRDGGDGEVSVSGLMSVDSGPLRLKKAAYLEDDDVVTADGRGVSFELGTDSYDVLVLRHDAGAELTFDGGFDVVFV